MPMPKWMLSKPTVLFCLLSFSVTAGLVLLYGCGGSGLGGGDPVAIIGGSVPVGTFRGVVVRADNPVEHIANATVSIAPQSASTSGQAGADQPVKGLSASAGVRDTTTTSNGTGLLQGGQQTDLNGNFNLGFSQAGDFVFKVIPPQADLTHNYAWPLTLTDHLDVQVVAALWPTSFDPSIVQSVKMPVDQVTMHIGDTIRFDPFALDKNGNMIPLSLSLMATGGLGTLGSDGTFSASTAGTGQMIGWIGGHSATTQIRVVP